MRSGLLVVVISDGKQRFCSRSASNFQSCAASSCLVSGFDVQALGWVSTFMDKLSCRCRIG